MKCPGRWRLRAVLAVVLGAMMPPAAAAQGDGPRAIILQPLGNMFTPAYLRLSSNIAPGNILLPQADLTMNVLPVSYHRFFSIGGRAADLLLTPIWGSLDGKVQLPSSPGPGGQVPILSKSGLLDPLVSLRVGLVGSPALSPAELAQYHQTFQLGVFVQAAIPLGEYDSSNRVNLGTNRWMFRFGAPMVVPFGSPARKWLLEIHPSVSVFTNNTDARGGASVIGQDPLFIVESHMTRNFSRKAWGGVGLRYQNGGGTTTDGVSDDNRLSQLGAEATVAYGFSPALSLMATYGGVIAEDDGSHGEMIRVRFIYFF